MKKMILCIGVFFYLTMCLNASPNKIRFSEIDSVKIYLTNLNNKTFVNINCEDFIETFSSMNLLHLIVVKEKKKFKRLVELINNCKRKKNVNNDVRIKIEFFKKKKIKHTLCISYLCINLDRETLVFTYEILQEVKSLCDYYKYFPIK